MRVFSTLLAVFALVMALINQSQSDTPITLEIWLTAIGVLVVFFALLIAVIFGISFIKDKWDNKNT